jgi:hypothetical protein
MERLNQHPNIWLCCETYFLYYVWKRRRRLGDLKESVRRQRVVDSYLRTNRIQEQHLDRERLACELMEQGSSYQAFFETLMRFSARQRGRQRFGEKTPDHALEASTLCDMFPDCALVHVVRDPRDVAASLLRMPWGDRSILANARRWLKCQDGALKCLHRRNYFRIQFEALVADPGVELARLCEFLGEEYAPEMLAAKHGEPATARWWMDRARASFDAGRLERWRQDLTPAQTALVEWLVRDQMQRFGYLPCYEGVTRMTRAKARGEEVYSRLRRRIKRIPGMWYYWFRPTAMAEEEATIDALVQSSR